MKKLLFALLGTITLQFTQAQAPFTTPDNIGGGNCLDFDGTNDYVSIPSDPSLDFGSGDFSVEAWAFIRSASGEKGAIISSADERRDVGFILRISSKVSFSCGCPSAGPPCNNNEVGINSSTFVINTWVHVCGVRSGNTLYLYNNGELVASGPLTPSTETLTAGKSIRIGRSYSDAAPPQHFYNGKVDEVRLWNRALTQTEIRDNMCQSLQGNEAGLVGYWKMDEGTGTTVNDLTSNNNHGTRQ